MSTNKTFEGVRLGVCGAWCVRRSFDSVGAGWLEAPPRKLSSCGDIGTGGKQHRNEDKDKVAENGLV